MANSFSNLLQPKPLQTFAPGPLTGGALPKSNGLMSSLISQAPQNKPALSLTGGGSLGFNLAPATSPMSLLGLTPKPTAPAAPVTAPKQPAPTQSANVGMGSVPAYTPPTTQSQPSQNVQQMADLHSQIADLQNKVNAAQNAGYSNNDQIVYDSSGNILPKGQTNGSIPSTFPGYITNILQQANKSQQAVDLARQNEQALQTQVAQQNANIVGQGADLAFKTGEQGALQQLAATKEAAAQTATQNALTAQGQTIGAAESAAGLTAPSGNFPFAFNPLTGQFSNSSGGSVQTPDQVAQAVLNGQMTYDQAQGALSYLGGTGTSQLQSAILKANPNTNITQLQAQGQGQSAIYQNIPSLTSANTAAQGISNTISSFLQQHPDLNVSNASLINQVQQWVQGKQLTDPNYQTLFNYLNEYASTLAPVLGVGGDPTNMKTQIAQSFINAQASGQSIEQVLANMNALASDKIKNIQSGATGGGVVSGPGSGTSTSSDPLGIL